MSTPKEESKTKETAAKTKTNGSHEETTRPTKNESKKDFRAGDWYCKMCQAHNFASRSKCFKCTAPREPPANFKMGDWMCPLCGAHNYRSKRNCFKCGGGKPATEGRNGIRPGDWMCPSCGAHNFKDKISCFSCTARKAFVPQMGQFSGLEMGIHSYLPANFKPGDWMCGQCGAHNYQSRTACYKCNNDKPSQAEQMQANQVQQVSQLMMAQPNIYQVQALLAQASLQPRLPHNFRPGDWMCGSCGAHNYRSRESCFKCNARKAKPEESQQQEEKQTQSQASAVHVSTVTSQPQAQEQPASTKSSAARTTTTAPQGQPQTQTQAQSQPTAQIQSAGHTVSQIPNQIPQGQMQSQMRSMGVMQGGYPLMQSVMPNPQQMIPHGMHIQMQPQIHMGGTSAVGSSQAMGPYAQPNVARGAIHFATGQWRANVDNKEMSSNQGGKWSEGKINQAQWGETGEVETHGQHPAGHVQQQQWVPSK